MAAKEKSASQQIDAIFAGIGDWRGEKLEHARGLIKAALPEVVEEIKWRKPSNPDGVPCWYHEGLICHGQAFKGKAKITFGKGAELEDPNGVFNASLEGNAMRAIDLGEDDELDEAAFKDLIRAAAALNES